MPVRHGTPEQYRTLADLIERHGEAWFQSSVLFRDWFLVAASDGVWRIHADGTFEKVKFVDHGFAT